MRTTSRVLVGSMVATAALAAGAAGTATADTPSDCSTSGNQVTCTYTSAGEHAFSVPSGLTSIQVVAVGAAGQSGGVQNGGRGAKVSGRVPVTPQATVYVEVNVGGGQGGPRGGGASDVRTRPAVSPDSLTSRLLVAAGGGAGGQDGSCRGSDGDYSHGTSIAGGRGGDAGQPGGSTVGCDGYSPASGGGAGGADSGGAGAPDASSGTQGQGGAGRFGGGGGGGGLFGGGGGGFQTPLVTGGGGGGGSSKVPDGGTFAITTDPASVTITYTTPDPTPPVVTPIVDGTQGDNGYYVGDVSLEWAVQDGESTVTEQSDGCSQSTVISADTTGTTFSCTATSAGGTTTASTTIKRDATNPTVALVGGPADGGTYAAGSVPAAPTCQASDATSGVDTCLVSGYATDAGPHTVTATATDKAGNRASVSRTYTVTPAPAPNPSPTHTAPPPADTTPPVSTVGVAPGPVPKGRMLVTITGSATFATTSGTTVGTIGATCWNSRGTVLTLDATDNRSGVAALTYAATGGQPVASTTATTLPVQVGITKAGSTVVTYAAKDKAGNQETTRRQTVVVDTASPYTCTGPTPSFAIPAHGRVAVTASVNGKPTTTAFSY